MTKDVYIAVLAAQELTADLQSVSGRSNCFKIARQIAIEGIYVISMCCTEMYGVYSLRQKTGWTTKKDMVR